MRVVLGVSNAPSGQPLNLDYRRPGERIDLGGLLGGRSAVTGRQVSVTTVISGVLWVAGAVIVVFGVVMKIYGVPAVGLLLAGIGGVMNIKASVARCESGMRHAFECGREHERGMMNDRDSIRSLR